MLNDIFENSSDSENDQSDSDDSLEGSKSTPAESMHIYNNWLNALADDTDRVNLADFADLYCKQLANHNQEFLKLKMRLEEYKNRLTELSKPSSSRSGSVSKKQGKFRI